MDRGKLAKRTRRKRRRMRKAINALLRRLRWLDSRAARGVAWGPPSAISERALRLAFAALRASSAWPG